MAYLYSLIVNNGVKKRKRFVNLLKKLFKRQKRVDLSASEINMNIKQLLECISLHGFKHSLMNDQPDLPECRVGQCLSPDETETQHKY